MASLMPRPVAGIAASPARALTVTVVGMAAAWAAGWLTPASTPAARRSAAADAVRRNLAYRIVQTLHGHDALVGSGRRLPYLATMSGSEPLAVSIELLHLARSRMG